MISTILISLITLLSQFNHDFTNESEANTGTIQVHVTGMRNNDGQILISVHTSEDGFPEENMFIQKFITTISAPETIITLKNIPKGSVAISILHDEDKSGEMTYNFIGMPKEGFGFYRNYKVTFRSPRFEEIEFELKEDQMKVEIPVQY